MSEQLGLNLNPTFEVKCMNCGNVQSEAIEPDEWSWVTCNACKEGWHVNPTQHQERELNVGGEQK